MRQPTGEAMKPRSRAGGEPIKGRRGKAPEPKRRNAPKPVARSNSSSTAEETEVTRLTRELNEALERQAATSEVLQVISGSPGDLQPVFAAMLENAVRICDAKFGENYRWENDALAIIATHNTPPAFAEARKLSPYLRPPPTTPVGRMLATKSVVHFADLSAEAAYIEQSTPALDDRFHETDHGTGNLLADSSFVVDRTRSGIMAGWRQAVALAMSGEEIEALTALSRSRTEPAGRVSRAAMLLGYREKPSFFAVGRRLGVHHQTVQRCVERAMAYGALAALDDRPRPGKEPTITPEAKAWLVSLACDKAKEHGYPHELWTTRLLARHARERGPAAGHQCLARLAQGTVCKLLGQEEIKPHKVRYYLERRDAEFEPKMAEVLCVYREVQVLKKAAAKAEKSNKPVAIVSYDEKPGIQAIATTAPDLPPVPGRHASFARDHEYKRHGTLSLLAGIDLLTGKVHALVRERHRSREFIEFLKLLDAAYPASTAIKLILDNHSAHISRETRAWLDTRPPGRFDFTFTPKHGSWLNLIEGFFSKFARAVLRHIRVTSKQELKERIMAGIDDVNRHPVIHTWSYKLAEAA